MAQSGWGGTTIRCSSPAALLQFMASTIGGTAASGYRHSMLGYEGYGGTAASSAMRCTSMLGELYSGSGGGVRRTAPVARCRITSVSPVNITLPTFNRIYIWFSFD